MSKQAPSHQWLEMDERLCLQLSRAARIHGLRMLFRSVSRLGNGVFWYALISFPSGHTLHAVAFTGIAIAYYPQLAVLLIAFTILVALSRTVLGLHYPSDVLAGAAIGAAIAAIALVL